MTSVTYAQTAAGQINGAITDPSGNGVSGAKVVLKGLNTGLVRNTVSSASGVYFLPSIPPGHYSLTVSAAGFQDYTVSGIALLVDQAQTFNVHLALGTLKQTVVVKAPLGAIDVTNATIGTVIGQRDVVEMPLNGRNFTELIMLAPGAAPIQTGQQNAFIITGGISPAVNGLRPQMNNFTLDGVDNNQRFSNTYSVSPPPDAIAEFKVASHETGADVSLAAGANVNIVTRSGTNNFHGSVWEFARNEALTANNYFTNFYQLPSLPFSQNQFGYYAGGPVFIPHLIDGRKTRTYWSSYYEGLKSSRTSPTQAEVPDAAERTGDFSDLLGAVIGTDCLGRAIRQNELYDPASTVANQNCPGGFVRNPFPDNTLPNVQPVAQAYLKYYYPLPNFSGTPNLVLPQNATQDANQYGIRLDQYISDRQQIFGRTSFYNWVNTSPGALPANTLQQQNHGMNIAINDTYSITPTFLVSLLFGYNRSGIPLYNPGIGGSEGAAFDQAVGPNFYNKFTVGGNVPNSQSLQATSFSSTGFVSYELANPDYSYQYNADFKKSAGRHNMSFGFHYMRYRHIATEQGAGGQSYTPLTTNLPGNAQTGESLASFMLGYPTNSNRSILPSFNDWGNIYNGYFGDTWKVTQKFTFDLGLQYVYASPPLVEGNKISLFDYATALKQPDATDFTFAYLWCSTNPITGAPPNCPRPSIMKPDRTDVAPRLGLAYLLNDTTVLRAGGGIYYDFNSNIEQNSIRVSQGEYPYGISQSVSGQNLSTLGPLSPPLSLDNPYPNPPTSAAIPQQSINPLNRDPYAIEYNLGIQEILPSNMTLSIDYVGSAGRRLIITPAENVAILGPGSISSRRLLHNAGAFPWRTTEGNSSYNAMQVKLEKAFSSGLSFLNSYTWSKSLDLQSDENGFLGPPSYTYDMHLSWAPSDFDLSQINTTSLLYYLPLGQGKRFGSHATGVVKYLISGWQTADILSLHSGLWSSVTTGEDIANIGDVTGLQTANQVSNPFPSGFKKTRAAWFNTNAYQIPAFGALGNSKRNSLRGPGYANLDFALMNNFKLPKDTSLQFRGEFFNAFNHTNLGNPVTVITNPEFGQILGADPAREIQLALKVVW